MVHLQQNAAACVPRQELKAEIAADIRAIFNEPNKAAVVLLDQAVTEYRKLASRLAEWLEQNIPEGLTVFGLPAAHQWRVRTTNGLERLNRELKWRTRVGGSSPMTPVACGW